MTSILSTEPWIQDPNVVSIPWRSALEESTLARAGPSGKANDKAPFKLGIFWTDGLITPQPPIARGLHIVSEEVKKAGHKACSQNYIIGDASKYAVCIGFQLGASFAKYS